jgi:hypothetical protein
MAGVYTDMVPVVSSNLKAAGWVSGAWTEVLEIEFKSGSLYAYTGVPKSVYDGLIAAPSKGKYFHVHVKKGAPYPCHKLR